MGTLFNSHSLVTPGKTLGFCVGASVLLAKKAPDDEAGINLMKNGCLNNR
jgi:hypothetical protein